MITVERSALRKARANCFEVEIFATFFSDRFMALSKESS